MNGQKWLSIALRVGGIVMAGVLAFAVLTARVDAVNLVAEGNREIIKRHEERIDAMQTTQIETVVMIRSMKETLEEIKDDLKAYLRGGN